MDEIRAACGYPPPTVAPPTTTPPPPPPRITRVQWAQPGVCGPPATFSYTAIYSDGRSGSGAATVGLNSTASVIAPGGGSITFIYDQPAGPGGACTYAVMY